ncbi:MAG: Smr/MutS family protein [Oligoflexales bacterium]
MAKKKPPKLPSKGVRFELEDDAEQLFLESLEKVNPQEKIENEDLGTKSAKPRKNRGPRTVTIDLHSLTADQAKDVVSGRLDQLIAQRKDCEVVIITGKGIHSGGEGGVLIKEIPDFVRRKYRPYIAWIEESPADVTINNVPIRGHFRLKLKTRS